MRSVISLNRDWTFYKEGVSERVNLPHTWNALDGQDGGDDYYRGCCYYERELECPVLKAGDQVWLEFLGVSATAEVSVNGHFVGRHEGGYSAFRYNITGVLKVHPDQEKNTLEVVVDNSANDRVYPQKADFTFYGGIYRDVNLIIVPETHIALDLWGGPGVKVTPRLTKGHADILTEVWLEGWDNPKDGQALEVTIWGDHEAVSRKRMSLTGVSKEAVLELAIENPHLWQGREDPYLYTVRVRLLEIGGKTGDEAVIDQVSLRFGCRSFHVDPDKGFFLNGKSYPLRGVSRHQDREGVGCALTREMHKEDMELIAEVGANSIRLAHYQHDPYFYDLCDEYGMVVWAEIPYITMHMEGGRENTLFQLRELILQNHHHAGICFWGISNEVTVGGVTESVLENNRALHALAKELDPGRLTTMACAFMLDENSPMLRITDVLAYNHYFGWYSGELEDNDAWFDEFRQKHPGMAVGLSEYGAEAVLKWQTGKPERGDYTEQYQALYHEHMLRMIQERPYLWCTYVWNMFDFAADGRDEGGVKGRNNKGLVTFDRKQRKDAFYLYKACWSKEPFVYIAGKRYQNRAEKTTVITVYTNQEQVELYRAGKLEERQRGSRVFRFSLDMEQENAIMVKSGKDIQDTAIFYKARTPDPSYMLPILGEVANWFEDIVVKDDCFGLEDRVGELVENPEGLAVFREFMAVYDSRKQGAAAASHMTEEQRLKTMRSMSLKELIKRTNTPPEEAREWLARLQKIKK